MPTPHDALFRFTFARVEHAAPLLRALLPAPLADAIDWRSLALRPGTWVDRELRYQHSDLLFDVRLRDSPALLYLLLEHQSRSDRWTALQLWCYVGSIWQSLRGAGATHLPVVIPVVVHPGRRGWTAPLDVEGLLDLAGLGDARDALADFLPRFRFLLDSHVDRSDDDLRRMALSDLGELTVALMKAVAGRDPAHILAAIARLADRLRAVLHRTDGRAAIDALSSYLLTASSVASAPLAAAFGRHAGHDAELIMRSTADRLRAEGKVEGKAALLLHLITIRFGPPTDAIRARLASASTTDLDRWAERILVADSADAVFDDR